MSFVFLLLFVLQSALVVVSCATTINQPTPPENYKGANYRAASHPAGRLLDLSAGRFDQSEIFKTTLQLRLSSLDRKNLAL